MSEASTQDLAAWLTAVWDEEERLATEASRHNEEPIAEGGEHWRWACSDDHVITPDPLTDEYLQCDEGSWNVSLRSIEEYPYRNIDGTGPSILFGTDEIATVHAMHIAYHDPASVLARIAADRKILALHTGPHDCTVLVTGTYPDDWPEYIPWGKAGTKWRHPSNEYFEDLYCPTARHLAESHKDRPGFRPEWLVERQGVEG
jgi:hypothetical protein